MTKNQEVLNLAVLAGEILIKNGGEIYRVEDTIMHIVEAYGITDYNVYVLSNGIFANIEEKGNEPYSVSLLYTSPIPRDLSTDRMPSSA